MKVQNHYVKMIRIPLVFLLFITFMTMGSTLAQAYDLSKVTITDDLTNSYGVLETINILLTNATTGDSFNFRLPKTAYDSKVVGDGLKLKGQDINGSLNCELCKITISYSLDSVVVPQKADFYVYSRTIDIPSPSSFSYIIKIPASFILTSNNEERSIVPEPTIIETDGARIMVRWEENLPQLPQRYYVKFSGHERTEKSSEEIRNELSEWVVWILVTFFFIVGGFVGFIVGTKFRRSLESTDMPYVPAYLLTPDEKVVIKGIQEFNKLNEGKIRQKNLAKTLGWSKSKMSSILTNLEYKEIIKREKVGRNQDIELIKTIGELDN